MISILLIIVVVANAVSENPSTNFQDILEHKNIHLLPGSPPCGRVIPEYKMPVGQEALLGQYPWITILFTKNNSGVETLLCEGSVINDKYVLTVAHCLDKDTLTEDNVFVKLGEYDMSTAIDCEGEMCAPPVLEMTVEQIIKHEKYEGKEYDIALLRLKDRIDVNDFVLPICLPTDFWMMENKFDQELFMTCGWGMNFDSVQPRTQTDILQQVFLQPALEEACERDWPQQKMTSLKMCVGGRVVSHEGESCGGDTGGPLMYMDDREPPIHFVLVGLVSDAQLCEEGAYYQPTGVYTRVSAFMQWILDHIRE